MGIRSGIWLLLATVIAAQLVQPSNNSADIPNPATSPRFLVNSTGPVQFPGFQAVTLGRYASISYGQFVKIVIDGILVNTGATNAKQVTAADFNLVSCDPEDYENSNLDASSVVRLVTGQPGSADGSKSILILYSTRSNHCNASGIDTLPSISGIFTTIDPVVMAQVVDRKFSESSNATAEMTPDRTSFTSYSSTGGGFGQGPTTAIAMIILYSITGIITALFVLIIITGAIRAHRHPERYGPRNGPGRPRQSRAKGIARAMLETLPIVKFGDQQDKPKETKTSGTDVEMTGDAVSSVSETSKSAGKSATVTTTTDVDKAESSTSRPSGDGAAGKNADGSDEAGSLGCSICTEDFKKGEEVRVLPCNHKFHPDCVDPWLLNVSGTCPLCRINLTSQDGEGENSTSGQATAPPLSPFTDRRSQAIHDLMAIAYGSREERITALRRHRAERRNRNSIVVNEEERTSRTRRFREALRITTRTHESNDVDRQLRRSGVDAIAGSPRGF